MSLNNVQIFTRSLKGDDTAERVSVALAKLFLLTHIESPLFKIGLFFSVKNRKVKMKKAKQKK